jgi:glycerate-2-kinase
MLSNVTALNAMEKVIREKEMEVDVQSYLADDNSYGFFEHIGDGIQTGKQESNVSDLFIVLKEDTR